MIFNARLTVLVAALPFAAALAGEGPAISYKPPPDSGDERPVATEITVGPQGSNIALELQFDRIPWGEDCKNQCANATVFLDTDGNPGTGVKLGENVPESGADLAITVQGVRDYADALATPVLKVKVRKLSGTAVDDSSVIAEYTQQKDLDRVQSEDERVFVLVDATSTTIPAGPVMRVVYHPPGSSALVGTAQGMRGKGKVQVVHDVKHVGKKK